MKFDQLMSIYNNQEIYNELERQIESNKIIVCFGSGMTTWAGYPMWYDLLINMAESHSRQLRDEIESILDSKRYKRYEIAAEKIKLALTEPVFNNKLKTIFAEDLLDKNSTRRPKYQFIIRDMFKMLWVTTNFDHGIEHLFSNRIDTITIQSKDRIMDLRDALYKGERKLVKIHGDINSPNNIIITQLDYIKAYTFNRNFRCLLKEILQDSPILFLGCSLKQDRIVEMMKHYKTGMKYAILQLPKSTYNKEDIFSPALEGAEWNSRRDELIAAGIRCLWYPYTDEQDSNKQNSYEPNDNKQSIVSNIHDDSLTLIFEKLAKDTGLRTNSNALDKNTQCQWLAAIQNYEDSDYMKYYLHNRIKDQLVKDIYPSTEYSKLLDIESTLNCVYELHESGVDPNNKLCPYATEAIDKIKKNNDEETEAIYKIYLKSREADLYFYQAYVYLDQVVKASIQYNNGNRLIINEKQKAQENLQSVTTQAIKLYYEIAELLNFSEIKNDLPENQGNDKYTRDERKLFAYICNSIAESDRMLIRGKKHASVDVNEFSDECKEALYFGKLATEFWPDRATYQRNYGVISENILDKFSIIPESESLTAYINACFHEPNNWKNYKTLLSYIDKWINLQLGIADPQTHNLYDISIQELAEANKAHNNRFGDVLNNIGKKVENHLQVYSECDEMQQALYYLDTYIEMLENSNLSCPESQTYRSIYYRDLYIIAVSANNTKGAIEYEKNAKEKISIAYDTSNKKNKFINAVTRQIDPNKLIEDNKHRYN